LGLFVAIVIVAIKQVEVMVDPILLGCLSSLDFLIDFQFVFMELQVPAGYNIIVSQACRGCLLNVLFLNFSNTRNRYLFFFGKGSFLWGVVEMFSQWDVAQDVVLRFGVSARSEIPWLFSWEIGLMFKTFQLAVKVHDIEGLLVSQSSVLI
jgi:hypothetical protein